MREYKSTSRDGVHQREGVAKGVRATIILNGNECQKSDWLVFISLAYGHLSYFTCSEELKNSMEISIEWEHKWPNR